MYPSPFRDDGYDISDYTDIHPSYGTLQEFQTFLTEAHGRGLRVIIELVMNHTSDQHAWFVAGPQLPGESAAATGTCGATPTIAIAASASSSSTPSCRTGPGTRCPSPTTGTGSSAISRT